MRQETRLSGLQPAAAVSLRRASMGLGGAMQGPFLVSLLGTLMVSFAQSGNTAPVRGLLLVANKGDRSLGIIDPASGRQVATVAEGGITPPGWTVLVGRRNILDFA